MGGGGGGGCVQKVDVLITQKLKFIICRSVSLLLSYITFPVFYFIHLFIREAREPRNFYREI